MQGRLSDSPVKAIKTGESGCINHLVVCYLSVISPVLCLYEAFCKLFLKEKCYINIVIIIIVVIVVVTPPPHVIRSYSG